jgi:hypothetical protein
MDTKWCNISKKIWSPRQIHPHLPPGPPRCSLTTKLPLLFHCLAWDASHCHSFDFTQAYIHLCKAYY